LDKVSRQRLGKVIQELAANLGIEVKPVPDFPAYCQPVMPSRITPSRMMPPLLLETAERILKEAWLERQQSEKIESEKKLGT
jgi:hypothetical protein